MAATACHKLDTTVSGNIVTHHQHEGANITNIAIHPQEDIREGNMTNLESCKPSAVIGENRTNVNQDISVARNVTNMVSHQDNNTSTEDITDMAPLMTKGCCTDNLTDMACQQQANAVSANGGIMISNQETSKMQTAGHNQHASSTVNLVNMVQHHPYISTAQNMSSQPYHRPITGIKRKLLDLGMPDTCHAIKRISPFHNTPIQKKETKRRILKLSLRKMRSIQCPETFLRRSVLINNLARSLQDDLKDDKLWDRWGWECDLDPVPFRQSHPAVNRTHGSENSRQTGGVPYNAMYGGAATYASDNACTMLSNVSPSNQWTVNAESQGNWLNGVDDAHLSHSERERVTRDLAQSHDRLAQTVERLTSFQDSEFHSSELHTLRTSSEQRAISICHPAPSLISVNGYCHNNDLTNSKLSTNIVSCSCGTPKQDPFFNFQDSHVHKNDINENQLIQCHMHPCPSVSDSTVSDSWFGTTNIVSVACSGLDAWTSLPSDVTTATSSQSFTTSLTENCIFSTSLTNQSETSNTASSGQTVSSCHPMSSCISPSTDLSSCNPSCDQLSSCTSLTSIVSCNLPERAPGNVKKDTSSSQQWNSCSSLGLDDGGPTYLDMTSNSFCRRTTDSNILDSVDITDVPHLTSHSSHVALELPDQTSGYRSAGLTDSCHKSVYSPTSYSNMNSSVSYSSVDFITASSQWGSVSPLDPVASSCPPSPSGSCSVEAERNDGMTTLSPSQFLDQPDRYSSQGLREFDVIYNNLVSVLIGGN